MTVAELRELPPMEWLVTGAMPKQGVVCLYGPSGVGKSFVALDLALSVAMGTSWLGMETKQGPVVYVAGEGGFGLGNRISAWEGSKGMTVGNEMLLTLEPIQLRQRDSVHWLLAALTALLGAKKPAMVVVDTFARSFVSGDENSSKDVGEAVDAMQEIVRKTSGLVVLVHHSGKKSATERGSTALRGASDAMFKLERKGANIVLTCDKQKDAEPLSPVELRLRQVGLAGHGQSCVVDRLRAPASDDFIMLGEGAETALVLLRQSTGGLKAGNWRAALNARLGKTIPHRTFDNWREQLKGLTLIESVARGHWRVTPSGALYVPSASELPLAA